LENWRNFVRVDVPKQNTVILNRPTSNDERDPERLTQTFLEQLQANQSFRDVADFFGEVRYPHIVPQLVREPDRFAPRG
jgi:hypothetical protein